MHGSSMCDEQLSTGFLDRSEILHPTDIILLHGMCSLGLVLLGKLAYIVWVGMFWKQ